MTQLGLLTADGSAPAERGQVHVHFGDWREAEPSWPRPHVRITDPPYGIKHASGMEGRFKDAQIHGDQDTRERDEMMATPGWQCAAVFGPGGTGLLRVPPWGEPCALLTIDKGDHVGMGNLSIPWRPNTETIAIYGDGWAGRRSTSILRSEVVPSWSGGVSAAHRVQRYHQHQKGLNVVCELVSKAPPGLAIVDPFMGSGTTAVACALLGREFYGAEIDPQYWDVIRGRLAAVGVALP